MSLVFEVVFFVEHLVHREINFIGSQFEHVFVEHIIHDRLSYPESFDVFLRVDKIVLFVVRPTEYYLERKRKERLLNRVLGQDSLSQSFESQSETIYGVYDDGTPAARH